MGEKGSCIERKKEKLFEFVQECEPKNGELDIPELEQRRFVKQGQRASGTDGEQIDAIQLLGSWVMQSLLSSIFGCEEKNE